MGLWRWLVRWFRGGSKPSASEMQAPVPPVRRSPSRMPAAVDLASLEMPQFAPLDRDAGAPTRRKTPRPPPRSRWVQLEGRRQKQAAAQERRQAHAAIIAHRKASDIVFLGRGVSRGLADRCTNVERLQKHGLPVLATPADLAAALGLSITRLRWLAFHSEASTVDHYVRFHVPKKSGGLRELAAPHRDLARCQRWILNEILSHVPAHPAAHGFIAGRSTLTNAKPHVGAAIVVNTDLENFFPSITFARVQGLLKALGYSPAAATILALLCTDCPRRTAVLNGVTYHLATGPRALPQGACTSPAISNLIAKRLDSRLTGIAQKLGWTYTRYADDATFSCRHPQSSETVDVSPDENSHVGYLLARIRHITADEGFRINEPKTRVLRCNTAQLVTGLVVNERLNVPRSTRRRLRAILHRARTTGLAAQNRQAHPRFRMWMRGMLAYVSMVRPEQGAKLLAAFNQISNAERGRRISEGKADADR